MAIPPNGYAGHAQQTPVAHIIHATHSRGVARGPSRRRSTRPARIARVKAKRAKIANGGKMRKGSPAAKAWGRKMKRLRRP